MTRKPVFGLLALASAMFVVATASAAGERKRDLGGKGVRASTPVERGLRNAPEPAAGGSCVTPTAFTATPYPDTGTTIGAVDIISEVPCTTWETVDGPQVVYSFVAGTGANLTFSLTPTGATWDPAIYLVSTCNSAASCVAGADDTYAGETETFSVSSLTAGTTYYLHVDSYYPADDSYGYGHGTYSLSVTGTLPVQLQEFQID